MHRIGGGPAQKTAGKTRRVREKGLRGKTACVRHRGNEGLSEPLGDQQLICLRSTHNNHSQSEYEVKRTV